ncbi:SAF domain-containing protein [Paenibacillus azoreducens]|uniref:SAF domain-containing protein n=1 Tax=Paenibacillus azoreducens TaxID=116718 RepID=UPI0039F57D5D
MSKLRQRTRHMLYAGLAGAAVMGLLFAGYAIYSTVQHHARETRIKEDYSRQIAKLEQERLNEEKNMASGWSLSRDVGAGETISAKDLVRIKLPQGAAPVNLLEQGESRVVIAKIEIKKGTALTDAMVYEQEPLPDDLRNRELKAIALPSDLHEHDVVDVRVQFPTGQDYIVLSKKKIGKLLNPAMWITMSEQEILSLSSAMVDAYLHDAKLYAVTYVEPEMQEKAIPTYPVNKEVLKLIESDPNIVKKAEQKLSEAVRLSLEKDLEKAAAAGKSGQSFADSEFAPSYSGGRTYSGESAASQGLSGTGIGPGNTPRNNGITAAGSDTEAIDERPDTAPPDTNHDSFSVSEFQSNKLLDQSLKEQQAGADQASTEP